MIMTYKDKDRGEMQVMSAFVMPCDSSEVTIAVPGVEMTPALLVNNSIIQS